MAEKSIIGSRLKKGALALALSGAMALGGAGLAFADTGAPFGTAPSDAVAADSNLLKSYGVRAGSAGPDFLGITNTNFDFTQGSASSPDQNLNYPTASDRLAGLSIWATSVNESVNPYYSNLLYKALGGTVASDLATTWMSNPSTSSWGDSNGSASNKGNVASGAATIAGLEYNPQIIFGANKYTNWALDASGSNSNTNIYTYLYADEDNDGVRDNEADYTPIFANNDATNIWTQVYSMGRLATTADGLTDNTSLKTRYNNSDAEASALDYERAIRGQMLYIASQIDTRSDVSMKTVAYLYAIDGNNVGYFFVPTADGLKVGNDTGKSSGNSYLNPDYNYAANNSTINMGYMGVLPFITNTFNSGHAFVTTSVFDDTYDGDGDGVKEGREVVLDEDDQITGMIMKVEDIYKVNPVCTVSSSDTNILAGVDVIIYNTTTQTNLTGTSGGKNSSYVSNGGTPLTESVVRTWAKAHNNNTDFSGLVIAGDDFGTSSNQGYHGTALNNNMSPNLYCERNYTCDKNARAAWAFARVYPELYGGNMNATYGYWLDMVYHINTKGNTSDVPAVLAYMTNASDSVTYTQSLRNTVRQNAHTGYNWWFKTGQYKSEWNQYAYYTGSSRASYYSGNNSAEETANTIGIFQPSSLWIAATSN